jgi:superfamily II DNA or RNA helicase
VRDYQLEGIKKCIEKRRALIISPTGSGKSLIIYTTISNYPGKKLIIVPTTSLVYQMKSDFESYNYKPDIQIIMSGQEKVNRENVVISTWQSIYKMKKDWFNQFEVIVGDEAHLFKAKSLTSIMSKASEVPYKFGFTGTLDDALTHRLVLEGLFGPVYKVTTTAELMHKQLLATLNIRALVLNYTQQTRVNNCRYAYQDEIRFLTGCEARTKFIANLAISKNTNTLVLFNIIDHGQSIYDHIKALVDTSVEIDRKVFFVYGGVNASEREEIRTIVEQETNAIIVASYGTFSTGINIKNLHNIVFASPSKSKIRVLQSIGRGLRVSDGSNVTTLYDIADNFEYKNKANYVLKHFIERVRFYTDEKFNYKIFPVDIGV